MVRTHPKINPSFDDADSFVLDIQKGVIHANIGDIGNFLNTSAPAQAAAQEHFDPTPGRSAEDPWHSAQDHPAAHRVGRYPFTDRQRSRTFFT